MILHHFRIGVRRGNQLLVGATLLVAFFGLVMACFSQEPVAKPRVKVTIQDEKPTVVETVVPVAPQQHAVVTGQPNFMLNLRVDGKTMHLGVIQTVLKFDGRLHQQGNFPGRMLVQNQPLPRGENKKNRIGFMSLYEQNKVQISQMVEVIPTKAPKGVAKRRLDAMLVKYQIENKDTQPHQVGVKVWMDVFLVNNDGALFAAPNKPGKILDGVELKDSDVPDYLQVLQVPNLKNPGYVAHFTYDLGKAYERPNRVVLTNLGGAFGNGWDMQVMQAMGDSAMGFFWDPKEIGPGKKRTFAYSYGEGICPNLEGEGQFAVALGGSFEPGKLFTIAAHVLEAAPGQYLALELPPGMERVEGKELQPVSTIDENGNAIVNWKARVLNTGRFTVRVRSSTGVIQTKIITISRPGEEAAGP
jgi:hypothetical protein